MTTTVTPLATGSHKCMCSFGTGSATITPIPLGKPVMESGSLMGQIQDMTPANLTPPAGSFNMCTSMGNPAVASATSGTPPFGVLKPQTCTPVSAGPWISPSTATTLINNQPSFMMSGSTRMCSFGGVITSLG